MFNNGPQNMLLLRIGKLQVSTWSYQKIRGITQIRNRRTGILSRNKSYPAEMTHFLGIKFIMSLVELFFSEGYWLITLPTSLSGRLSRPWWLPKAQKWNRQWIRMIPNRNCRWLRRNPSCWSFPGPFPISAWLVFVSKKGENKDYLSPPTNISKKLKLFGYLSNGTV